MNPIRTLLLTLLTIGATLPSSAYANFITIVTSTNVTTTVSDHSIKISVEVQNDGDEPAKDVALSIPKINQSFPVSGEIRPNSKATVNLNLSFDEAGVSGVGDFVLPSQVTYKDSNYAPFSSLILLSISVPPNPAKALIVQLDPVSDDGTIRPLRLADTASVDALITSIANLPVNITEITPLTASEIVATLDKTELPAELAPGQEKRISVKFKNLTAIPLSNYASKILVSGVIDGRHFAEVAPFSIEIVKKGISVRIILIFCIVGLALAVLGKFLIDLLRAKQ